MREKKGSIGKTTARARGRVPFSGMQIMAAAIACLVIWNICLQVQLLRARPRMEAYLPKDLYVAVGNTMELYNSQVVVCGLKEAYTLSWDCEIGKNMGARFSVEGLEEQLGDYPLVLEIYDWNDSLVERLTSTLHVVDAQMEGEYSILNIGDSLSNGREWYRKIFYLSDGHLTFAGTRGWTKYSHEGRSGFSPQDYLGETAYSHEGEGVHPFYDPAQERFDWNYYKLKTGIQPDVIQIFLGINGLKDDPSDQVDAITQMVNNIRSYDQNIPIYIVNTPYVGDQDHMGSMELPDGSPWFRGEHKKAWDWRVMHLMKALQRKLGNYSHVTFVPLALMHDSAHNFDMGEALHPNDRGDEQFASCMYGVYCGTLEGQLR